MFLKPFYLILGVVLSLGAVYLGYRRLTGIDGEDSTFSIILCGVVGGLCLVMYRYIDVLRQQQNK